jgi:hypothetical protein
MTPDEKYLFDLNGYLVVDGVLSPSEVALANEAIDKHAHEIKVRTESLADGSAALVGRRGRGELGGLQAWEEPYGGLFRKLLAPPKIIPHMHELLGKGFRLDHDMFLLSMDQGTEGFYLHGKTGPDLDLNEFYFHRNGKMYCGLSVVSIQLTDVNPGDGGFAVVPGSHKANFKPPASLLRVEAYREQIRQIACKAGSAVLFPEAITHGTLPWTSPQPRRTLLTRYTRAHMAYVPVVPPREWAGEREKLMMEGPYHAGRFNRPALPDEAGGGDARGIAD